MASVPNRGHSRKPVRGAGPDDPASKAIVAALATAVERLRAADSLARAGAPEGVHRLRTASRRLRSELQSFGKLIDPTWSARVIAELRWLGAALGETRDLDVLRDRFERGESEEDREALSPLFDWLAARRAKAGEVMEQTLTGKRFRDLVAHLERSAAAPPTKRKADKKCRKVLPPLVAAAWKRLRRDAEGLASDSPDPAFHEVRKRAKRARYTTESIAPTLGKKAEKRGERLVEFARSVQDLLGAHQDAVVAADEVAALLAQGGHDDSFRRAAAALLARLRRDADEYRDTFLDQYLRKLGKRKNRGELLDGK
ncbi:CHAD domain-containing protein [Paludisphaera sp.]|uniref:CHAD domain-containing protein n=1 Tax=Paludisphaera sp. TaxID=2017432 RepID=UPI00301D40E1